MSPSDPNPPALSRHLIDWASRRLRIPELGDDATDLFRDKAQRLGERPARRWYRRQALASLARVVLEGTRARPALPFASWLDVRLAGRMLSRHPGLTVVAVFVLAIGIPVGLLPLHVLSSLTEPLPVEDAEEVVVVRNFDRREAAPVTRALHDYVQWREELSSFEAMGMWRSDLHNVSPSDGRTAPIQGAEVTASVFSLLRVPPLLGRTLDERDMGRGAPDVVVIGYELWQSRMLGKPNVVGSTIRVGGVPHTVVGVMPDGFLFPIRDHLWLPFRHDPLAFERGTGPAAWVIGRLGDGVSIERARREIEFVGERMAREFPATHAQLQPQILPYTSALTEMDSREVRAAILLAQVLAFLLLALACGNVGILILARTATRSTEIAVRTALGASRTRILSQLFIESLLLAVLGAGVGLVILQAVATGPDFLSAGLPFWVDFEVSLETASLAVCLAVASAVIAGVVPAVKATGKDVRASMQHAAAGRSGIRFGTGYSALIVGEVAAALLFLALGSSLLPSVMSKPAAVGIRPEQYLHASVRIPRLESSTSAEPSANPEVVARVATAHRELVRRLSQEPRVGPAAIANALPGMSHPARYVEVEGLPRPPGAPAPAHLVNVARVDLGYFDALDQAILSGRSFSAGDLGGDRSAVIVNTSFVERVLGGRNPLGRRVRYWTPGQEPGPWSYEIVGVVGPLGMNPLDAEADQGMYHVVAPGELHPLSFAIRVGIDPGEFTPRLRSIVSEIDASASIQDAMPLAEVPDADRRAIAVGTYLVAFLAGIAVVLAAACLYALMSFTVAERRRESAIRAALGARPASIVSAIATRAFVQLSAGVLIGVALSAVMFSTLGGSDPRVLRADDWPVNVGLIALFMIVVGMLACVRPTLRALRIQPVEALKG